MHVFFINKYQTEFTESIDKTYIYIYIYILKTWTIKFSWHIPLPQSKSWISRVSGRSLHISSLDYPKSNIGVEVNFNLILVST